MACHSATSDPTAVGGDWSSALQSLASSGVSIYSLRFDGPLPGGAFYTLAVHDVGAAAACDRYGNSSTSSQTDEFWYLDVTVNDDAAGDHAITLVDRDGTASATANVTLLHRKQGAFVEAYHAVSGDVSLTSPPGAQQIESGALLLGRIEADFPSHAVQEESCEAGGAVDGSDMISTCTCRDSSGIVSTCTPGPNGQSCCDDLNSPRVHVSIGVSASSCRDMCRWAAGLPDYCSQYLGPP